MSYVQRVSVHLAVWTIAAIVSLLASTAPVATARATPLLQSAATTVELTDTDDAGVVEAFPDFLAPNAYLILSPRGNGDFDHNFVLFDLSVLPANATIDSAELRLNFFTGGAAPIDVELGRVDGAWDETSLTWNTQPAVTWGGPVQTVTGVGDFNWPATPLVQAWQSGAVPNYGFVLRGISGNGNTYLANSKETGIAPKLVITYHTPVDEDARPDLGDAPDSTNNVGIANTAYPGINGNFPTVWSGTPANQPAGPRHANHTGEGILGNYLSRENEADGGPDQDGINNILNGGADNANNDRGDDGWRNRYVPFNHCQPTTLTIRVYKAANAMLNKMYLNVWFDAKHDGDWDDVERCQTSNESFNVPAYEWIVQDFVVDLTAIAPGGFVDIPVNTEVVLNTTPEKAHWMRFMLSEEPAPAPPGTLADGRGPHPNGALGAYRFGETEDVVQRPQPAGEVGSLELEKRVLTNSDPVEWLDVVTYQIRLRHNGGSQPIQAQIRDDLAYPLVVYPTFDASGVHWVTVESPTGGAAPLQATIAVEPAAGGQPPHQVVKWQGTLAPNAEIVLTFDVRVITLCAPDQQTTTLTNLAKARARNAAGGEVETTAEASFVAKCLGYDENHIEVTQYATTTLDLPGILSDFGHYPLRAELHNNHAVPVTLGLIHEQSSNVAGAAAVVPQPPLDPVTLGPGERQIVDLELRMESEFSDELKLPDDYAVISNLSFCILPGADNTCPDAQSYPQLVGQAAPVTFTVRPNDLGDAPDSTNHANMAMTAYPGRQANFPTVFDPATGLPEGPRHSHPRPFHLGKRVSREAEADIGPDQDPANNIEPAANLANLDRGDDGARVHQWNLADCQTAVFPVQVAISPQAANYFQQQQLKGFINIWIDENRDGDWDDGFTCQPLQGQAVATVEHVVIDHPIDVVALGAGLHIVNVPATGRIVWPAQLAQRPAWVRVTLSERESNKTLQFGNIKYGDGRGYPTPFHTGETEDYLAHPEGVAEGGPDIAVQLSGQARRTLAQASVLQAAVTLAANSIHQQIEWNFKLDLSNQGSQTANGARLQFQVPQQLRDPDIVLAATGDAPIDLEQLRTQFKAGSVDYILPPLEPNSIIAILIGLASSPGSLMAADVVNPAAPAAGITLDVSANTPGDTNTGNNQSSATASLERATPYLAIELENVQITSYAVTCRTPVPLRGQAEPNSQLEIVVDGKVVGTVASDAGGAFLYSAELGNGVHHIAARYPDLVQVAAKGETQFDRGYLSPGVRVDIDPSLPIDPLSLTFTDSQGRVFHPATLGWPTRTSQGGWPLHSGETYQVAVDRCGSDPNVQMQIELENTLVSNLRDSDGDGRYTGSFTFNPGVQAAAPTANPPLRLAVTSSGAQQSFAATLQTLAQGTVRNALNLQPLANTSVAALIERLSAGASAIYAALPTDNLGQPNPQLTGADGGYSFAVAGGNYRLDTVLAGYQPYRSDDIAVNTGLLAQDIALTPVVDEAVDHLVYVTEDGFEPAVVQAQAGDVVMWVNADLAEHSAVHSGGWDSGMLAPGAGYTVKLEAAGHYGYADGTNPFNTGTILVGVNGTAGASNKVYLPVVAR